MLDVNTWQATTKLAKATPDAWTITCKAPASHNLPQWCVAWCQDEHGKQARDHGWKLRGTRLMPHRIIGTDVRRAGCAFIRVAGCATGSPARRRT